MREALKPPARSPPAAARRAQPAADRGSGGTGAQGATPGRAGRRRGDRRVLRRAGSAGDPLAGRLRALARDGGAGPADAAAHHPRSADAACGGAGDRRALPRAVADGRRRPAAQVPLRPGSSAGRADADGAAAAAPQPARRGAAVVAGAGDDSRQGRRVFPRAAQGPAQPAGPGAGGGHRVSGGDGRRRRTAARRNPRLPSCPAGGAGAGRRLGRDRAAVAPADELPGRRRGGARARQRARPRAPARRARRGGAAVVSGGRPGVRTARAAQLGLRSPAGDVDRGEGRSPGDRLSGAGGRRRQRLAGAAGHRPGRAGIDAGRRSAPDADRAQGAAGELRQGWPGLRAGGAAAEDGDSDRPKYQYRFLIDMPTAGVLDKGLVSIGTEYLPFGVVIARLEVGVFDDISFGISYGGVNIIGAGDPDWYKLPAVDIRFRLFQETLFMPTITLGFNSQGKGIFSESTGRYGIKSPGIFWRCI